MKGESKMEKLAKDYVYYLYSKEVISFDTYFDKMNGIRKANGDDDEIDDVSYKDVS